METLLSTLPSLPDNTLILFGSIWLCAALFMIALWFIQLRIGNANAVDAGWSLGTGVAISFLCIKILDGHVLRNFLTMAIAGIWSTRLGFHLFYHRALHSEEDPRYAHLRSLWGAKAARNFFILYQVQAFLIVLFSIPAWAALHNPVPGLTPMDIIAVLTFGGAILGEWIADRQLLRYQKRTGDKPKVCEEGLWKYSRHPNYFFEWVGWWSYVFLAWDSPMFLISGLGPILMFVFLTRISGIPPTEAASVRKRGDAYRDYQARVSAFFPWFPKRTSPKS